MGKHDRLCGSGTKDMKISRVIATFGGCGLSPKAPGTVASLAALLVALPFMRRKRVLATGAVVASVAGWWAADQAGDGEDHGWIVIDEVAGMWISLLACTASKPTEDTSSQESPFIWSLVAFALFRLFDIRKPGPVGVLDRRHDALGIMGDDIVAGIMAAGCIKTFRWLGRALKPAKG